MLIDFKEILKANEGSGLWGTFELLARDFLKVYGYVIIQEPDGKRALLSRNRGKELLELRRNFG